MYLVPEGGIGHVQVLVERDAGPVVVEVIEIDDRPGPDLPLVRQIEAVVHLRTELVLVEAHGASEVRVPPVRLPVRLDHRIDARREGIRKVLTRHTIGEAQRVRRLREAGVLVDEIAQRVAHVARGHQVACVSESQHGIGAELLIHAEPRKKVPRRAVPRVRAAGAREVPRPVVDIAVALRRHQLERLRRHRRRRRLHLGNRLAEIELLRETIVGIDRSRLVLPAQAGIDRQTVVDVEVVLEIRGIASKIRILQRYETRGRLVVESAQHERRPLIARVDDVR